MSALSAPLLARLAMRAGGPAMPADREAAGLVDGDELLARLEQAEGRSTLELTGEWATDRREGDPPGPLLREHVLAIAGRNGWRCQDAEPRGDAVLAVRQRLRAALQTHAAVLAADGFDAAAALRELAGREQALAAGRSVIERLRLTRADVEPVGQLVAVDAARSGESRVGVYTGVWTAGETLGMALGPALYAVVLSLGGYLSSQGEDLTQPDSALTAIALGFSVIPALLVVGSLWWLRRYTLDAAEVAAAEGLIR